MHAPPIRLSEVSRGPRGDPAHLACHAAAPRKPSHGGAYNWLASCMYAPPLRLSDVSRESSWLPKPMVFRREILTFLTNPMILLWFYKLFVIGGASGAP